MRAALVSLCIVASSAVTVQHASAGGFDTPILYSARHMGMGGTSIGYVNDPSAVVLNPAGLSALRGVEIIADVSPLIGTITTSPGGFEDSADENTGLYKTRTSETIIGPAFLLGAGYRLSDWLVFGLGAYPIASASAEYKGSKRDFGTGQDEPTVNRTKLTFIEASPALSFLLPHDVSLGVGYRITLAQLERVQGWERQPQVFDFEASGVDATGFRAGVMWRIDDHYSIGALYRHKIEPELTSDEGVAAADVVDLKTKFILPSRLGLGGRADLGIASVALDLEWGFYSQNDRTELTGCNTTQTASAGDRTCNYQGTAHKLEVVDNVFEWSDAPTVRIGAEVRATETWPLRIGYVYDGKVASVHYPSAFGTPPAASHSITAGAGFVGEGWQLNIAGAYRMASTRITPAQTGDRESPDPYPCATCGKAGDDYSLSLFGAYLDFSYNFVVPTLF